MHRCSQCGQELTETYYRCWYAGPEEENTGGGDGGGGAEWIQVNMDEYIIEKENDND